MTSATPFTDVAVGRLCEYAKDRPNVVGVLKSFVQPMETLVQAFADLRDKRTVATATGAALDIVGSIVGQLRLGLADDDYRRYVNAKIVTNRSAGRVEDLIRITRSIIGPENSSAQVEVSSATVATVFVRLLAMVPGQTLANVIYSFLNRARSAGVRLLLETLYSTEDTTFTTATAAFASAPMTAGDTSIVVDPSVTDTSLFPPSGSLDLDLGLAVSETVSYASILSGRFLGVSALAHSHTSGAVASLTGAPGLGFGTVAFAATSITSGATSVQVDTTEGFPSSGTVDVMPNGSVDAEGDAPSETLTYTSKDATHLLGMAFALNHDDGVLIRPSSGVAGGHMTVIQDSLL